MLKSKQLYLLFIFHYHITHKKNTMILLPFFTDEIFTIFKSAYNYVQIWAQSESDFHQFIHHASTKTEPRRLMSQIAVKLHYFTHRIQFSNKQLCSSSIAITIMLQSSGFIPSTNARRKLVGGWPVRQSQATRTATRNNSNCSLNQPPQPQSDQSDQIR